MRFGDPDRGDFLREKHRKERQALREEQHEERRDQQISERIEQWLHEAHEDIQRLEQENACDIRCIRRHERRLNLIWTKYYEYLGGRQRMVAESAAMGLEGLTAQYQIKSRLIPEEDNDYTAYQGQV